VPVVGDVEEDDPGSGPRPAVSPIQRSIRTSTDDGLAGYDSATPAPVQSASCAKSSADQLGTFAGIARTSKKTRFGTAISAQR
jgi:hypothetical protein